MSTYNASTPLFPTGAVAVTPSDSATFAASALYVGTGGTVVVLPAEPDTGVATVTFTNVPAASVLPVMVRAVFTTGTTASGFVRLR